MVDLSRQGLPPGARFAHQPDIVAAAMTGGPVATDWSSALKSGYDLLELAWPVEAYGALGIDAATLPEVVAPGAVLGESSAAWEQSTGLPAGTAVVAGMTDGCASQLGAGAMREGDWHSVIGTTLVLKGVTPMLLRDELGAIYSHRSPQAGHWLPGGASSVGARAMSALLGGADLEALERDATALRFGAAPPTTYPLIGSGERFPFVRPDATGFVRLEGEDADLTALGHGAEAYLAIASGVAYVERLCFDTLAARGASLSGRLSSSGGGTRSALWNQLRADALARPIALPESAEPSLGMAILAASAIVEETVVQLAGRMTRISRTVDPDPRGVEQMAEGYDAFRDVLVAKGWIAR
jgi:sugar (pentulose or hexulose) kinase